MCPKLTVLWITSLLFDLITNLLTGASLLALEFCQATPVAFDKDETDYWIC